MSSDKPKADNSCCAAPPMTFGTLVLSLAQSSMDQIQRARGAAGDAATEPLQLARQSIDVLEMLECKTKGNLEDDEAKLLNAMLYEVRVGYLAATGGE